MEDIEDAHEYVRRMKDNIKAEAVQQRSDGPVAFFLCSKGGGMGYCAAISDRGNRISVWPTEGIEVARDIFKRAKKEDLWAC